MRISNFGLRISNFVYADVRDLLSRKVHRAEDKIRNSKSEIRN
jgi:hypothetical protein